jgi:hypothetical protein
VTIAYMSRGRNTLALAPWRCSTPRGGLYTGIAFGKKLQSSSALKFSVCQLDFYFSCGDRRRLEQEKIIVFLNTRQILKRRTRGKLLLFGIAALYNVHSFLQSREILR